MLPRANTAVSPQLTKAAAHVRGPAVVPLGAWQDEQVGEAPLDDNPRRFLAFVPKLKRKA